MDTPDDFPDWLSPMLVKELRQGVRTRMFVVVFILLQIAMLMDLVLSLLVAANHQDASGGSIFFWVMVAVPVLLIVPLGGINAIGGEIRGNTLELIFLTRLTVLRIVAGKWLALFVQSLLLVCAVLPYQVLRYFMGGVNVAGELVLLGTLLLGSALLTAFATAVSAFPSRIVRPLAAVGAVLALIFGAQFFVTVFVYGRLGSVLPSALDIVAALLAGVLLLALLLDLGAARIAPPAENHSGIMRALAMAMGLLAVILQAIAPRYIPASGAAFVIAYFICAIAVCEGPRPVPSLYRTFARWGLAGRLAGRLFYPGWYTGTWFTLAIFGGFAALFSHERFHLRDEPLVRYLALLGVLLFPVALARTVFRQFNRPIVIFFTVHIASVLVFIFCAVCDGALNTSLKSIAVFLPLCGLMAPWPDIPWHDTPLLTPVAFVTALSALTVLLAGFPVWRQMRVLERDSLALPAPPAPPVIPSAPSLPPPAPPDGPLA